MIQRTFFEEPESIPDTGFHLRPYQAEAVENAFDCWKDAAGCIVRLPTGCGKTFVGAMIAKRWIEQGDDYHVMVIAHERQLIWQFADEIEQTIDIKPAIEMSVNTVDPKKLPKIVVASRATILDRTRITDDGKSQPESRPFKFDNKLNWLIIWDEAHKHAYGLRSVQHIVDWFDENPNSKRLGLTATPERTDKVSLAKMFPAIAIDYRLYDLDGGPSAVNDGWCVPYDQRYVMVESIDFANIREVAADFDQAELARVLSEQKTLARMIEPTLELVGTRKTIIFSVDRAMAQAVALYINAKFDDQRAQWLDGTFAEKDRKRAYFEFRYNKFQFLSVCGLCREGFNDPGIQAVAIFRPTKSRPLAEQMKGRGCRTLKGVVDDLTTADARRQSIAASEKPDCMIVDLVGATGLGDCASTASIYADALPDRVMEKVNALATEAAKDGRRIDMEKAIADAEDEVSREEEEERRRAEARAEAEKRKKQRELVELEAKKRARLEAQLEYHVQTVNGHTVGVTHSPERNRIQDRIMIGKYAGRPICDLPDSYLAWAAVHLSHPKYMWKLKAEADNRLRAGNQALADKLADQWMRKRAS